MRVIANLLIFITELTSLKHCAFTINPGFHNRSRPVATIAAVVEKSVLTQMYFLSDATIECFHIIATVARLHDREFFYR